MSPFHPTIDEPFRQYADLQLRRHDLVKDDKEHAPETEAVEGRMEEIWEKLEGAQRRSLSGMGSDLNWVRRNGEPAPRGRKAAEEVTPAEQQELAAAIGRKDWHTILHYLRLCAPVLSATALAQLRGHAYDALRFSGYASVFFGQAADWEPGNPDAGVFALSFIEKAKPEVAFRRAQTIIESPLRHSPVVLAYAALMVLRWADNESAPIDRPRFLTLLNNAAKRLPLETSEEARAMAYQAAASGFEIIDDLPAARSCLEEGLRLSPTNDTLLVGRGLWLYFHGNQTDRDEAINVFDKLAQKNTTNVWPYFLLAHYYLLNRDFGESLEMSQRAWTRDTTDRVRAQLLEWQGICQAELSYPPEVVRPVFEKAISLDPSNQRIVKNLAAFVEAEEQAEKSVWQIEDISTLMRIWSKSIHGLELANVA